VSPDPKTPKARRPFVMNHAPRADEGARIDREWARFNRQTPEQRAAHEAMRARAIDERKRRNEAERARAEAAADARVVAEAARLRRTAKVTK
jgi:hypothetical protein